MSSRFCRIGCLSTLTSEQLRTADKPLVDSYSIDFDNSLVDELRHFAAFADIFKYEEPGVISTELFFLKIKTHH